MYDDTRGVFMGGGGDKPPLDKWNPLISGPTGKKKKFKPPPGQIPEYAPGWLLSHILSKTFSFSRNAWIYVQTHWK